VFCVFDSENVRPSFVYRPSDLKKRKISELGQRETFAECNFFVMEERQIVLCIYSTYIPFPMTRTFRPTRRIGILFRAFPKLSLNFKRNLIKSFKSAQIYAFVHFFVDFTEKKKPIFQANFKNGKNGKFFRLDNSSPLYILYGKRFFLPLQSLMQSADKK